MQLAIQAVAISQNGEALMLPMGESVLIVIAGVRTSHPRMSLTEWWQHIAQVRAAMDAEQPTAAAVVVDDRATH